MGDPTIKDYLTKCNYMRTYTAILLYFFLHLCRLWMKGLNLVDRRHLKLHRPRKQTNIPASCKEHQCWFTPKRGKAGERERRGGKLLTVRKAGSPGKISVGLAMDQHRGSQNEPQNVITTHSTQESIPAEFGPWDLWVLKSQRCCCFLPVCEVLIISSRNMLIN